MVLEQHQLLGGDVLLALRPHGLYVRKKELNGHDALEVEMPYEELLPIAVQRRSAVPTRSLAGVLFALLLGGQDIFSKQLAQGQSTDEFWTGAFLIGGLLGLIVYYGLQNWWKKFTISTARLNITLADRPGQRAELYRFAEALESQTKSYLRHHYGRINPLGPIELQLSRLRWLRELNVLNEAEAHALSVRLTGRHSETLQGMGHELEAPFVN
ncbi:hypothetical protein [Hymenobacter sp. BT491]|uniref:hypothetical protein n=1 Tax=Hymenobacter sp. BT491 TaxID=2766779 RepID=UPI001653C41C|nr:hypothetical protein [Hymenobacter sp. BT491]MBC6988694.1 hypothetical protein [Hymenobacter sp. BT491]